MKLKKIVAAAAAAVMALAMLTACSGGGGGGGVTVKKIAYKDSRMAQMETQVASTKQLYLEMEQSASGITTTVKMAVKNNAMSLNMYVGNSHWMGMIQKDNKKYDIEYPDYPYYNYVDEDGKKLKVPVYKMYLLAPDEGGNNGFMDDYDENTEVEVGTYPVAGKNYYAESITDEDGDTTTYCFDGMKIVAMVETEKGKQPQVILIKNFRNTDVPDSLFKLPDDAVDSNTLK